MSRNGTTLSIRPQVDAPAIKITKIIPYKDGGFALVAPYHSARSGYVAKFPVDYTKVGKFAVSLDELVGFTADDRVKLSYHPDGFAQFSSEIQGRVISGRDPTTGEPKGVGLITAPLSNPIRSGPSMGVTAWGLGEFEELDANSNSIVFSPDDIYYRGCTPETACAWAIEFFVFPNRYWAGVRSRGNQFVLSMTFRNFEASGANIEFAVIPLLGQPCFIAAFASRILGKFPSASGWILSGPGQQDAATGKGHVLQAYYPRDVHMEASGASLDRARM